MKKFLSAFIAAALILTVSACGNNTPGNIEDDDDKSSYSDEKDKDNKDNEDNDDNDGEKKENFGLGDIFGFGGDDDSDENTPMTETTTSAPETEATTSAPETEATTSAPETEATTSAPEGENLDSSLLDGLKGKSPLYYEFAKITSSIPCTLVMTTIDSDGKDNGTATMSMESLSRIAVSTDAEGQNVRFLMDNGTYYIINDSEKSAIFYSITDEEKEATEEEMANAMNLTASFDFDKAEFTSGTEEFMGETLKYEAVDDGTTSAVLYFIPETGRVKYMVSEGQTVRVDDYYTGIDESLFEIPEDYEMLDFESLMGELTATE